MTSAHVCVAGAGMAGLVTTAELLREGHRVTCFEQSDSHGGVFSKRGAGRYGSFRLTVSQRFMAFSTFDPPPDEAPRHWTRREYLDYLTRFAEAFGLLDHVRYQHHVQRIRVVADGVRVEVEHAGRSTQYAFDAIAVCKGAFRGAAPRMPTYAGRDRFAGEILHSASYRGPDRFRGRRVICVGLGESSADITREISEVADRCWLSMRSWPALVARYPFGKRYTNDAYSSRLNHWLPARAIAEDPDSTAEQHAIHTPLRLSAHAAFIRDWNIRGGRPQKYLQKNDDFVGNVMNGKIEPVHHDIRELCGTEVVFADGSRVRADAIVCCTGYEESGIPNEWIDGVEIRDVRALYKHAFDPVFGARVAFVGWARPYQGGVPACAEMIARYFSLLCSGRRHLPPRDELEAAIERDAEQECHQFFDAQGVRTLVDYTKFLDDVAEHVGCGPDPFDAMDDPEFAVRLLCASNIGASYRLRGPHADPARARRQIRALPVATVPPRRFAEAALRARFGDRAAVLVRAIEPTLEAHRQRLRAENGRE